MNVIKKKIVKLRRALDALIRGEMREEHTILDSEDEDEMEERTCA